MALFSVSFIILQSDFLASEETLNALMDYGVLGVNKHQLRLYWFCKIGKV